MAGYPKCKDCIWLGGERSSVGIECMQPENQKKWAHKEKLRKNAFYPKVVAKYKQPTARACKKFEPIIKQPDCPWK